MTVQRRESYARMDSFMTVVEKDSMSRSGSSGSGSSSGGESATGDGEFSEKKKRRLSRFREELGAGFD